MRWRASAWLCLALLLAACVPRATSSAATPAATPAPASVAAPAPAPTPSSAPAQADPPAPLLACKTDGDCAVKDVGSCCGARPACVNAQAPTFPDEVKARCAREGRMGICGFQPVSGCQCVSGQCESLHEGALAEPGRLQ